MTAASTAALQPLVDALVADPVDNLGVETLQLRITLLRPQVDRLVGWLGAAGAALQHATGGQLPTDDGGRRSVVGWLAQTGRTSPSAAGAALRVSSALRDLPLVADAVLDGVLTPEQAAVLARLVGKIPVEALHDCQPQLVEVAAGRNPVELEQWVRHLVATHAEPVFERDLEAGRRRRFLQTSREADGCLRGRFVLAPEQAEAVLTALEPLARVAGREDTRSIGQRRADALAELAEQVLGHGDLPVSGGQRPQVSYVLPADWAAARQAEAICRDCGPRCEAHAVRRAPSLAATVTGSLPGLAGLPAEHACAVGAWTGPQSRGHVEALLCDARITRVLLDSIGQVAGLESLTDDVTPRQRRALAARDLGCAAHGCTRPPALCDAHHLVRRADGGAHTLDNLVLLCRRHHVLWHLGKLHLRQLHVPWHPDSTRDWGEDFVEGLGTSARLVT